MILVLASLLLAHPVAFPDDSESSDGSIRVEGRCLYSSELEEEAQGASLIICGEVILGKSSIAFAPRGFSETVRFEGEWHGDDFTIGRVVTRGIGGDHEASGTCHVVYREGEVIRLAWTATAGPHGYVANFVVPVL